MPEKAAPRKTPSKSTPKNEAKNTAVSSLKPEIVAERISQLTSQIVGQAESLRTQVQDSEIQRSLKELRDASVLFQDMTQNATSSIIQPQQLSYGAGDVSPARVWRPNDPAGQKQCGCGSGCGDECKPKCCIQLYMSALKVIDGQGVLEGRLELVAAVQAGDTWGLVPGLSSFISVPPGTNGVKLNEPIANFCVPCGECMTVPLHAEVMEQSNGSWAGALWEGKLEVGSAQKSMTLRCDCDPAPIGIAVGLTSNEKIKGVVEVEISAKRKAGGCC